MAGFMEDNKDKRILSFEEKCRLKRKELDGQVSASGMTSLGSAMRRLQRIPQSQFVRMGGRATEQEVLWTCEKCGPVPARRYSNGYLPGKCACQLVELEQRQDQQRRLETWKAQQERYRKQCIHCYTWLGDAWSDPGMEGKTFENFENSIQTDAFLTALSYAEERRGNLILWSDKSWGTGKTHLAAAICNHSLSQNVPSLFSTAQNMFNAFAARMDDHHGYSDLLAMAGSYPLLVIDDLDKVHLTSYKQSIFFEVLDKRYKRRVPTIITTNAHVEIVYNDVSGVSDYIGRAAASRLTDEANGGIILCEMNGEDFRRRKR